MTIVFDNEETLEVHAHDEVSASPTDLLPIAVGEDMCNSGKLEEGHGAEPCDVDDKKERKCCRVLRFGGFKIAQGYNAVSGSSNLCH